MQQQSRQAPYQVLGVSPTASQDEVIAAYKVLAQIFHPDRYADSSEAVRRVVEIRMKELNEAYRSARAGALAEPTPARPTRPNRPSRTSPTPGSGAGGPGGRRFSSTPWDDAARERATQAVRAERARREREQSVPQGKAVGRPRNMAVRSARLRGLGLARFTDNIVCPECASVQWLPPGWREMLDDTSFYCSLCDGLIFTR